ncbi:MAG TPA: tetratricopeptide repeat protein, partial [Pyrinomonadaceae bacterium]|nr:tetratricopeptide repeat protein [Pyrinomonadaceae bacterium]
MNRETRGAESSIASLSEARNRTQTARQSLERELEEVRLLLDQGLTSEVLQRTASLMRASRQDASLLARARCLLSAALEMQGRYRESLEAVQMYEQAEERAKCDPVTSIYLDVQLGLAYNYTGDHPKAIALLNGALREATAHGGGAQVGSVYVALARVYRSINEYTIARDHAQKALEHFRGTGDWRGLAEANFAIALAELFEGNYEPALNNLQQSLKLIGDHPAPYLLGKLYTNMAGVCWFLKRPHDGIKYLETAISYYERTEHKANAADGYNNLGIHLVLVGEWDRAQGALERALALASETDKRGEQTMILDSLGELLMLRGELEEAGKYLERAVELSQLHGNKWYAGQALRTLGRCHLASDEPERALADGLHALEYAEQIGDRHAVCDSRLLLGETHLRLGDLSQCAEQLNLVLSETADSSADLAVSGEAQRLQGLLSLAQDNALPAAQHFGRSVSIYEMLGDRYRSARARYDLGRAYADAQPERAHECLTHAAETFRELGARLDIERTEDALGALERNRSRSDDAVAAAPQQRFDDLTHLILMRLTDAVASRELLLRELAAVVYQETGVRQVLIAEPGEIEDERIVVTHGWTEREGEELLEKLRRAESAEERRNVASGQGIESIELRASNARPATLLVSPQGAAHLPGGVSLAPLLRMVELGL